MYCIDSALGKKKHVVLPNKYRKKFPIVVVLDSLHGQINPDTDISRTRC